MPDFEFPFSVMSEEEVIMKTNSDIISSLADALANVETGKDSAMLLGHIQKHADLILTYSEKLILAKRLAIKAVT
tara:strand:- start:449 stop:673 length:225 start_codon:yes stop_codon:yes gene_type:complete